MNRAFILLSFILIIGIQDQSLAMYGGNTNMEDPYASQHIIADQDTIPPITDRYGDFITDPSNNPFDLDDPSIIDRNVEYDPLTGLYNITERIGEEYYRMPSYMTFEEYLDWKAKQQEQNYFNKLSGASTGSDGGSGRVDPIAKFDIKNSLLDRLFCGTQVDIRPQGNIDLTFGVDFQRVDNPILTERQRRQGGFDFDMNIQMNVTGQIGEKLKLATNYNTQATFDFENQMKLEYASESCNEDEIIKSIEAG